MLVMAREFKRNALIVFLSSFVASSALALDVPTVGWKDDTDIDMLVLTPTRIGQSLRDTPGTVTVLTRTQLLNRGITSIPEALSLVPGMIVKNVTGFSQVSGHDYEVAYHGGSGRIPRRLQVQVDGMSVYLAGLSKIDWAQMPVTVHDIERIEITRNPGAASYGANSFSAIVNVITRHPTDASSHEVVFEAGSRQNSSLLYRASANLGGNAVSFRASTTKSDGYDYGKTNIRGGDVFPGHRDSMGVDRFSLRLDRQIGDKTKFSGYAGAVSGDYEAEYVVANQDPNFEPDIAIDDHFINIGLSRAHSAEAETRLRIYSRQSQLEQDFRACSPLAFILPESFALARSNKAYINAIVAGKIPSGGTAEDNALAAALIARLSKLGKQALIPVCGTLNHDYIDKRHHLTLEHHQLLGDIRMVGGITMERLENTSETFFAGSVSQSLRGIFLNAEWKPSDDFTYNAGVYRESTESGDKANINPRASMNWHATPRTTFRVVANRAHRSPDLAENKRSWSYRVRDVAPVIQGVDAGVFAGYASSDDFQLEAERIDSMELGVLMKSMTNSLSLDARVFYEELDKLISEKPGFNDFNLTNSGNVTNSGAEASVGAEITSDFSLDVSYSYQDHDFQNKSESGLSAKHQGQAALIYSTSERVITTSYLGHSQVSDRSFDQWSLTWIEKLRVGKSYLNIGANLAYMPRKIGYLEADTGLFREYGYDDDVYGGVSLELSF